MAVLAPPLTVNRASGAIPLVGHAIRLRQRPLEFLAALPAQGDLVEIRLGRRPAYVATHPELVRQILRDSSTFDKGGPLFDKLRELLGNGLASSAHEQHRRQRRLLQPAFHRSRLAAYAAVMTEEVGAVMQPWREGAVIDAHEEMYEMTLRVAARTMFAAEQGADAVTQVRDALPTILDVVYRRMTSPFDLAERLPTPANRRYNRALADIRTVAGRLIDDYRRSGADHMDLLSMLLAARDEDGGALADEEIHEHVISLLGAGADTTAATLSWALYLLSLHPDVEKRLHAEVDAVLEYEPAGWRDLERLDLTKRILTETLRLYPPGWLFTRITTTATQLAGRRIAQGTVVLWSPYVLHHRADLYPQPERFDPDRWLPERAAAVPKGAHIPFGAGARNCIGRAFGTIEATIALASIARTWQLQAIPGVTVRPEPRTSLHPDKLPLRLVGRTCR